MPGLLTATMIRSAASSMSDDRSSKVDGRYTLSSVPAGEPIYVETDTLKAGEKRQLESAHPGGVAVATYKIIYADGREEEQEFKSYYRKWPAKYLVGKTNKEEITSDENEN